MPPPSAFTPPETLEGFRIGRLLRSSGPLVVHAGTNRLELPVEAFFAPVESLTGGFEVDDFLAGVRRAASVHHESLLPFVTGGRHAFDTEFVFAIAKSAEGPTLADVVAKEGLTEKRALAVAEAVCGVLSALEKNGMRHGDLSPARIVFATADTVVVGPPRLFPASIVPRDEKWQAPEEARGSENGVQSDLFVLGLIFVHSLTGVHPLGASSEVRRALRDWKAPDMAALLPRASGDARALAARLLAPEPMNRPASAADALHAIHDAIHPPETAPIAVAAPIAVSTAVPTLAPIKSQEPAKRPPGRLYVDSRLGEATLELDDDVVHVGPGPNKTVRTQAETFPEAKLRVERAPAADVVQATGGDLRVNGLAVAAPHSLADGDKIQAGDISARYERTEAPRPVVRGPREPAPAQRNPMAAAVATVAVIGTAAALSWGVLKAMGGGQAPADAKSLAAKSSRALDEDKKVFVAPDKPKTPVVAPEQKERDAREAYELAKKNARRHPAQARIGYYETWQRFPDSAYGLLARLDALAIDRAQKPPIDAKLEAILAAAESDGTVDEDMLNKMRTYAEDHGGTLAGERAHVALVKTQALQNGRFDADMSAIRAAMTRKDWREALTLIDQVMSYAPRHLCQQVWTEKEKIQAAMSETLRESATGAPPPGGDPNKPKDPGPGSGAEDKAKRAEDLFKSGKKLMETGKEAEALDALMAFLREGKGTPTYLKYELEARGRINTLSFQPAGMTKLFHGKAERGEKGRWKITYDFQDAAQLEDFRDVNAFEAPPRANWKIEGGAVRSGKGSGALILDAVFSPADVAVSVVATPEKPHDLGVMFMDPTQQQRFYLYVLQNTFFTLSNENPQPFLENAVVLFGPDMWAKTLPGKLGFVRKCGSDEPAVRPNESTPFRAGKTDDEVWMKFEGGRSIRGSAFGDKPYSFPGIMPGLFVIKSSGFFDDFVVEGTPDADWVRKRWDAILSKL